MNGPDYYVHGYNEVEDRRLNDQAGTLAELLHRDSVFQPAEHVLEAGCGVGAQTAILASKNPETQFTCIDLSATSLEQAQASANALDLKNVTIQRADIFDLPFDAESFDHVFLCFVLEHLPDPVDALKKLQHVLKPGGTITAIEGDHGSTYFHPQSDLAWRTIQCLIDLQAANGGDALIGRRLFPLFQEAGLSDVAVDPRMVYVDGSKPELIDGFTHKTFIAMVQGVREKALAAGMMTPDAWDQGIAEMTLAAEPDGVFCYTFFKGVGKK